MTLAATAVGLVKSEYATPRKLAASSSTSSPSSDHAWRSSPPWRNKRRWKLSRSLRRCRFAKKLTRNATRKSRNSPPTTPPRLSPYCQLSLRGNERGYETYIGPSFEVELPDCVLAGSAVTVVVGAPSVLLGSKSLFGFAHPDPPVESLVPLPPVKLVTSAGVVKRVPGVYEVDHSREVVLST